MIRETVETIFRDHGFPVYFAGFDRVRLEGKDKHAGYKTVFMTYISYAYTPEKGQNICRYAALEDYHRYLPEKLSAIKKDLEEQFPENIFDIYTDNSPIDEKTAAEISGLGMRGLNTLIITKDHGSFILLAEIISDLEMEFDEKEPEMCARCGKCEAACPSGALRNGVIDRSRCVSALTQKKGELSDDEKALIIKNGLIWGCDRCQEVCPYNENAGESEFAVKSVKLTRLESEDLEGLTEKQFREKYSGRAFTWRGLKTIQRNIDLIERKE